MSTLNDLFEQIIQSEERIRKRFAKLRNVNKEIHEYQVKYQDFMDELKSLQGLLTLKNQTLAEEELSLKWFTIQEGVSAIKRRELSEGNEHLFLRKGKKEEAIANAK
ncbi:uncharacterized protein LOC110049655 [Orbicella faveolata]|uniref:uncharacterized protein LOC110049655 n=1 Tax=Orbicella faveolata TaxID=48498 RepID=UPI0009E5D1B7|nr:uncharacterized protein LOC110049655 [Orbicella faveolata]